MNCFLFAWNPENWKWSSLEDNIEQLNNTGSVTLGWSLISHTKAQIGDRAFLIKLGKSPRGIMGSGFIVSEPYLSPHWSEDNKQIYRVRIEFDTLLHPYEDELLTTDLLNTGNLANQNWSTRASGITIQPNLVADLEALWFDFLSSSSHNDLKATSGKKTYFEGAPNKVTVTRYERNPHARSLCLDHYGFKCAVCEINYEDFYGEKGKGIIHVHHLEDVAGKGGQYQIDPITDMRPVCPNCHAVIHSRRPHYSIEEVRQLIEVTIEVI